MVNIPPKEYKELSLSEINSFLQHNHIPCTSKLLLRSQELIEKFKELNEEILQYVKREKDYKIRETLYKTKLIELQNLEIAIKEKYTIKIDFSNILESYMTILRNIKELLNKRIDDLTERDEKNKRKELIFKMYLEKKAKVDKNSCTNTQNIYRETNQDNCIQNLTLTDSKQKFFDNLEDISNNEDFTYQKQWEKSGVVQIDTLEKNPSIRQIYTKKRNSEDSESSSSVEKKPSKIVKTNKNDNRINKIDKKDKNVVHKKANLADIKEKSRKNIDMKFVESSNITNTVVQSTEREDNLIKVEMTENVETNLKNDKNEINDQGLSKKLKNSSNKNLDAFINSNNQNNIKLLIEKNHNLTSSKESLSDKKEITDKYVKNRDLKDKLNAKKQNDKSNNSKDNLKENVFNSKNKAKNPNVNSINIKENPKSNYRNSYKERKNDHAIRQQNVKEEKKLKNVDSTTVMDDNDKKLNEKPMVKAKNRSASVKIKGKENLHINYKLDNPKEINEIKGNEDLCEKTEEVDQINPLVFSFEGKESLPRHSQEDLKRNMNTSSNQFFNNEDKEIIKGNELIKISSSENQKESRENKILFKVKSNEEYPKSIDKDEIYKEIKVEENINPIKTVYKRKISQENNINKKSSLRQLKVTKHEDIQEKNDNDIDKKIVENTDNILQCELDKKLEKVLSMNSNLNKDLRSNIYISTDKLSNDELMKISSRYSHLEKKVEISNCYSTIEKIKINDLNENPLKLLNEMFMYPDKNGDIIKITKKISDINDSQLEENKNHVLIETFIQKDIIIINSKIVKEETKVEEIHYDRNKKEISKIKTNVETDIPSLKNGKEELLGNHETKVKTDYKKERNILRSLREKECDFHSFGNFKQHKEKQNFTESYKSDNGNVTKLNEKNYNENTHKNGLSSEIKNIDFQEVGKEDNKSEGKNTLPINNYKIESFQESKIENSENQFFQENNEIKIAEQTILNRDFTNEKKVNHDIDIKNNDKILSIKKEVKEEIINSIEIKNDLNINSDKGKNHKANEDIQNLNTYRNNENTTEEEKKVTPISNGLSNKFEDFTFNEKNEEISSNLNVELDNTNIKIKFTPSSEYKKENIIEHTNNYVDENIIYKIVEINNFRDKVSEKEENSNPEIIKIENSPNYEIQNNNNIQSDIKDKVCIESSNQIQICVDKLLEKDLVQENMLVQTELHKLNKDKEIKSEEKVRVIKSDSNDINSISLDEKIKEKKQDNNTNKFEINEEVFLVKVPENELIKANERTLTGMNIGNENYEHKTNSDYTHVSTEKNSVYRDSDKQQRNEMQIVVIHQDLEEDEDISEELMKKYKEQTEKIKEMAEDSIRKEQQLRLVAQDIQNLISHS